MWPGQVAVGRRRSFHNLHVVDTLWPRSAVALSQTKPVKPCLRSELDQEAEADLLLGGHGEASCCFSQAPLPGRC